MKVPEVVQTPSENHAKPVQLHQGWKVYDAAGHKLGTITAIYSDHFVVESTFLFTHRQKHIDRSSVGRVEQGKGRVYLA